MGRRFAPLGLDEVEHTELRSLASRRSTAQALALRARIILACAEGEQSKVVAARLAIDPDTHLKHPQATPSSRQHSWRGGSVVLSNQ